MKYKIEYEIIGGTMRTSSGTYGLPIKKKNISLSKFMNDTDKMLFVKCLNNKSYEKTDYDIFDINIKEISDRYKSKSCNTDATFYNYNCLVPKEEEGINVVKIPTNFKLFKGMGRVTKTNLDLSNVFGNKKAWYSDFEIASLYARKNYEGLHVYKPQRELTLFCLNDTSNLKLLFEKIDAKARQIFEWTQVIEEYITNINLLIKMKMNELIKNDILFNFIKDYFMIGTKIDMLLRYCNYGENWRKSQKVIDLINQIKNFILNKDSNVSTQFDINGIINVLKLILSEIEIYPDILRKESIELKNKKDTISFTTGYGMTWQEQLRYMQTKLIDRSISTNRFNFSFRNLDPLTDIVGYDKTNVYNYKFYKFRINNSIFGKGKYELNRISLSTDEDLQMCNIIEEFFNVDGYWSNSVISYFHERGTFPREICIFNGRILNRDKTDVMDWFSGNDLPTLPENYKKILYYDFNGNIDYKSLFNSKRVSDLRNIPIDPLTYLFRGHRLGDSARYIDIITL